MPLPTLTHLQFTVLKALGSATMSGSKLRAKLKQIGYAKTLAAFYQIMARLEDSRFVEGWYQPKKVGPYTVNQRWYKVTAAGASARALSTAFYTDPDFSPTRVPANAPFTTNHSPGY